MHYSDKVFGMDIDMMIEEDIESMPMGAFAVLKGIYVGKCVTRRQLITYDGDRDNIDEGLLYGLAVGIISKNLYKFELTEYGKKLIKKISEEYGWDDEMPHTNAGKTYYKIEIQMHDPIIVEGCSLADGMRKLADELEKPHYEDLNGVLNERGGVSISSYFIPREELKKLGIKTGE